LQLVSIIIPAYNSSATLQRTLQSCLGQFDAQEIIVVNDGSTDDTLAIAQTFSPAIKVVTQKNQGVSSARNLGFQMSSGGWIQFVDADDIVAAGSLAKRIAAAELENADVVVCDFAEFLDDIELEVGQTVPHLVDWRRLANDGAEIACATSFWAPPAAVLYRRTIVEKIGGFRGDLPVIQDARFLFDAAFFGAKFSRLADIGAFYRIQSQSLSRKDPQKFLLDCLYNVQQIEALWHSRGNSSPEQSCALVEIFSMCANGLLRIGRVETFDALRGIARNGGRLSIKLVVGSMLLKSLGPRVTARFFRAGSRSKKLVESIYGTWASSP